MELDNRDLRIKFSKQTGKLIIIDLEVLCKQEVQILSSVLLEFFRTACLMLDINDRIPYILICSFKSDKLDSFLFLETIYKKEDILKTFLEKIVRDSSHFCYGANNLINMVDLMINKFLELSDTESLEKFEIHVFSKDMSKLEESESLNKNQDRIKRVCLVNLYNQEKISEFDIDLIDFHEVSFVVDIINLKLEKMVIIEYFKNWLNEVTEYEHLKLIFPSKSVIKCDLYERVLDPEKNFDSLNSLTIQIRNNKNKKIDNEMIHKSIRTFKLEINKFVSLNGICESLIYGDPYILKPTSSYKTSFNESIQNSKNFKFFSDFLKEKKVAVLCNLEVSEEYNLTGNYLIIPITNFHSQNSALLMKSIASKTILLNNSLFEKSNYEFKIDQETASQRNQFIDGYLRDVPVIQVYNPLQDD
ncbi:unnamed protein product [Brachionus calyciflorus]|uniref:Uncharacterized protein n=1 Tax=Brachionus calyciflorus TaxID=104777 RepID=A0A813RWP7_9BILA|nr:unnamed protein product [Brachionus calyciflorus]